MRNDLSRLAQQVQKNCHISDALFARDYSLCIYLLKMREYFRWEKGYSYAVRLPEKELGDWLVERERLWQELEDSEFQKMALGRALYDPFDGEGINQALLPEGLVYSGGYGGFAKPHFFLAELHREESHHGFRVLVTGKEHARDITAPPAMTLGTTVFVRRESLRRMLWERLEEWQWRKSDNPMGRAIKHYDFDSDFEEALDRMTDKETESVLLHEIGEAGVGKTLGEPWNDLLSSVARSKIEHLARAARDHLADCTVTLPRLIEAGEEASLHFYFANLSGVRRSVFPTLLSAYEAWHEGRGFGALERAVQRGREHWRRVTEALMDCGRDSGSSECLERVYSEAAL